MIDRRLRHKEEADSEHSDEGDTDVGDHGIRDEGTHSVDQQEPDGYEGLKEGP